MAKPSERNKKMMELADEAVEDELEKLRTKKAGMKALAVKLDDVRWAVEQFAQASHTFIREQGSSKPWLIKTLKIQRREATLLWPPRKPTTTATATGSPNPDGDLRVRQESLVDESTATTWQSQP